MYVEYACELHAHGINWKHAFTLNMYENYMRMAETGNMYGVASVSRMIKL